MKAWEEKKQMRGSLHSASRDETPIGYGRDDVPLFQMMALFIPIVTEKTI
jgi:hypothetical protein